MITHRQDVTFSIGIKTHSADRAFRSQRSKMEIDGMDKQQASPEEQCEEGTDHSVCLEFDEDLQTFHDVTPSTCGFCVEHSVDSIALAKQRLQKKGHQETNTVESNQHPPSRFASSHHRRRASFSDSLSDIRDRFRRTFASVRRSAE